MSIILIKMMEIMVINNNDYVMFKSKTEDIFPQGYYIKKLNLKK